MDTSENGAVNHGGEKEHQQEDEEIPEGTDPNSDPSILSFRRIAGLIRHHVVRKLEIICNTTTQYKLV